MLNILPIIYQDDYLVAINKPSGLLVHRSAIDRHETRFALQILRDQLGQHVYPVHRLDKPTSGVLLFALSSEIASSIAANFAAQQVTKSYLAIVRGQSPISGIIDHALKPQHDKYANKQKVTKPAQNAMTHYRRIATVELPIAVDKYPQTRYSLLEVKPVTGRKHQIRRHLKHIAHPIIGDPKHGKSIHNRFFGQQFGNNRLLLACTRLELPHPVHNESLVLTAKPDDAFMNVIRQLGWAKALACN